MKSSYQCWDLIRAPSEQSPENTEKWTSLWPSREVQEAGGMWCSSSSSMDPASLWSSLCWWLVHAVQPPVPSIIFLLIRKAAFKTAFSLGLRYYRASFPLAVLSSGIGFWGLANTLPRGYCARLPSWRNCSRRRYQHRHTTELPPNAWDQPVFCLRFFMRPESCPALLYTACVVLYLQLAWLNAQWPICVLSVFWNIVQKYL